MFGENFARGKGYDSLAEGVATSHAMMILKERYHTELPICTAVYETVMKNKDPKKAISELFLRSLKDEFV